jgi:hypothetical protein
MSDDVRESPPPDPGRGGTLGAASESASGTAGAGSASVTRGDLGSCAAIGVIAFGVYLLTLSRGVLGGDAGELQFVPPILGLTHPTGYPLQVLVHYVWSFVPIGSVAYRLNLLDAGFAAVAVGLVVAVTRLAGAGRLASAFAGLSLAFGEIWWSQAVRGDKYTLNGLFLALVLLLYLRWRRCPSRGRLLALALAFGLSLTHHRSMLLVAPALGVGMALDGWRPWPPRSLVTPVILVVLPLLLYLYVPWGGSRGLPPGSWPVDTPAAFAEFLLDRGYTSQLRPDAAFRGRLVEEAVVLVRSFGPLGALLGLIGLGTLLRRDWRLGTVTLLVFVPQAVVAASYLLESHYGLPRHWVFFLPAFLIWSVWLGVGVDAAARRLLARLRFPVRGVRRRLLLAGVLAAFLGVQAGSAWVRGAILLVRAEAGAETMDDWRQDFQRSPVAERFGRLAFAEADENAVIVCDWEQATVLWYLQRVEGRRPDLTIRYPIERLDETLAEVRGSDRAVYLARTLPGVESRGVTSSVGPLLQVYPTSSAGVLPSNVADMQPVGAVFESGLTLQAVRYDEQMLHPGSVIPLTLYWLTATRQREAFAVSVRLVGPDGSVLASRDVPNPALGTSPADRWQPGQFIGDYHELPLGSRLAPGTYRIVVQPYRTNPTANLRRIDSAASAPDEGASIEIYVEPRTVRTPLDLIASLLAR